MAPTLEALPVELLEQIALDLQYMHNGHIKKLRLTSRTIKAKVHRVFLLKFSRRLVSISARKLLYLHKLVHYEDFGAGITRLFLVPTEWPPYCSEGPEPMLKAESSNPDIATELQAIVASATDYAESKGSDACTTLFLDCFRYMPNLRHIAYHTNARDKSVRLKQIMTAVALAEVRLFSLVVNRAGRPDTTAVAPLAWLDLPEHVHLNFSELKKFQTTCVIDDSRSMDDYANDDINPLIACLKEMHSLQRLCVNGRNSICKIPLGSYLTWKPQRSSLQSLSLCDIKINEAHVSNARLFLQHHRDTLQSLHLSYCDLERVTNREFGNAPVDWSAIFGELKHFRVLTSLHLEHLGYDGRLGYFVSCGRIGAEYRIWDAENQYLTIQSWESEKNDGWVWVCPPDQYVFEMTSRDHIPGRLGELEYDFRIGY